ncbi:MAG: hypothetical protein AB2A00_19525 [Myxococcota bacterium]
MTKLAGTAVFLTTLIAGLSRAHAESPDQLGRGEGDTHFELEPGAVAYNYAERGFNLPHGVAADAKHVYVTEPLGSLDPTAGQGPRVAILNRLTGEEVAELPPPPEGFVLPFGLRMEEPGKLVVLDAGGFPSPLALAVPRIHVYRIQGHHERIRAELVRSVMVQALIIFSEELEVIGPDRYVISDSGFGALWVIEPDDTVRPGIIPETLSPPDAIPALSACPFPGDYTVGDIPFEFPGNFAPGVGALGTDGTYLYMSGTCRGGISRVPLAVFDDDRAPWDRAADIQDVFVRPAGEIGTMKGLLFSRDNPDDNTLYALEPFNLRLVRIDVASGERTVVLDDPVLFNFPVAAAFLPANGMDVMVITSDQEQRLPFLNAGLDPSQPPPLQLPFLVTKAFIKPGNGHHH